MTEEEYLTELSMRWVTGDWVQVLEDALQAHPDSWQLWQFRGRVISFHADGSEYYLQLALDSFHRATELAPDVPELWEELADFYQSLENQAEAEKCVQEAARARAFLEARMPKSKFALFEVVRICSQPPDRRSLIGELGAIELKDFTESPVKLYPGYIPQGGGEYLYTVHLYRCADYWFRRNDFWEAQLEPTGQYDGFYHDEPAESAGCRAAELAISSSQLYLCACGGLAVMTPEIPEEKEEMFKGLPRRTLAAGCTDPRLQRAHSYACAFNREIVRHLLANPSAISLGCAGARSHRR